MSAQHSCSHSELCLKKLIVKHLNQSKNSETKWLSTGQLNLVSLIIWILLFALGFLHFIADSFNVLYRIRLNLFTHKNGDFCANSVMKQSCAMLISKVESHISDECSCRHKNISSVVWTWCKSPQNVLSWLRCCWWQQHVWCDMGQSGRY